jgi:DNA-binding NtrC family response regulator
MISILVVDDDDDFRISLIEFLEDNNFAVQEAADVQTALEILDRNKMDLIITDILLPEIDGLEFIEQLKKERVSSKIIAMSGGGRIDSEHYLRLVQAYGVEFTIDKPFGGEKLICLIERVLENSE